MNTSTQAWNEMNESDWRLGSVIADRNTNLPCSAASNTNCLTKIVTKCGAQVGARQCEGRWWKGLGKDSCLCIYRKDIVRTSAWQQQWWCCPHLKNIRRGTDSKRVMFCMIEGRFIVNFIISSVDVDEGRRFSCGSCAKMKELSQRGKIWNSNYWQWKPLQPGVNY